MVIVILPWYTTLAGYKEKRVISFIVLNPEGSRLSGSPDRLASGKGLMMDDIMIDIMCEKFHRV